LPHDVAPGERHVLDLTLPPIAAPGTYVVVIDLVIEGVAWFAERGSMPLEVPLHVA
jgi:hypothetical protein